MKTGRIQSSPAYVPVNNTKKVDIGAAAVATAGTIAAVALMNKTGAVDKLANGNGLAGKLGKTIKAVADTISKKASSVFSSIKEKGFVKKAITFVKDLFKKVTDKENGLAAKVKGLFGKVTDKENGIVPKAKSLFETVKAKFVSAEKV